MVRAAAVAAVFAWLSVGAWAQQPASGTGTAPPRATPAAKPAAGPAAKPGAASGAKPGTNTAAKPQNKPQMKPQTKPGPKPGARPAAKPGSRPAARPVAKPPTPAPAPVPAPEPEKPVEPSKGSNTGLPIPRFASLRSDDVNMRSGPGTRYPIEWQYKRRDLPVQIEREFEIWRLVRDQEGVKGWVHQATLAPRRTGVVIDGEKLLRRDPKDDAAPVARLKPGVIVRLRNCEQGSDWCQGQVQDYRGWIKRSDIWGSFPGEAIQ